jgi:hypothetical protein
VSEKLSPERAVRLLRAKNSELEHAVLNNAIVNSKDLMADVALLYALLADHIEDFDRHFDDAPVEVEPTGYIEPVHPPRAANERPTS